METFASWFDLLTYLESHTIVHYKAPLEHYPIPVVVTKKYKNGKLRIQYHDMKFTADQNHLDRFRWKGDCSCLAEGPRKPKVFLVPHIEG